MTKNEARVVRNAILATPEYVLNANDANLPELISDYKSLTSEGFAKVSAWCRTQVDRINTNKHIGQIQSSNKSIRSILRHSGKNRGPLKVLVFLKLNEILRDAVPYNYGADGDKSFYSLAHRISFEDAPYICRVTVEENQGWE